MDGGDLLEHLRAENARLIALLESHGIEWRLPDEPSQVEPASPPPLLSSSLDTDAKLALFKRLFRGRADVFPVRWESKAGSLKLRTYPTSFSLLPSLMSFRRLKPPTEKTRKNARWP